MNKSEFVAHISDNHDCTRIEAEKALKMVTESIISALGQGNAISLIGFGNFEVQQRAAREGRNPKTGEPLKVPAYNQPSFKAGKSLKDACNGQAPVKDNAKTDSKAEADNKSSKTGSTTAKDDDKAAKAKKAAKKK